MILNVLSVILVLVGAGGVRSQTQSGSFSCAGLRDGFYANPASCASYYICATNSSFLVQCASGLEYNSKTRFCDWPQSANCSQKQNGSTTPSSATQTNAQTTTPVVTNNPGATTMKPINLVFTKAPFQAPSTTMKPIQLVFTTAAAKTHTPASTNQPTKLLVFTPPAGNTGTPQQTFRPVVTNAPVTQAQTTVGPGSTPANYNTNFCQGQTDGLHRDANDCGSFYNCFYGFTVHDICPPGTAYNEVLEACDYPGNVPGCNNYG